jgi:phosphoenolpyruvate carboxykinase (ATP)
MSLKVTRKIIDAIHSGAASKFTYNTVPGFNFKIPQLIQGVDSKILDPV